MASVSPKNQIKGDISFSSIFIEPGLQLGFSFTPNFEMIFYGGYQFPVYNVLKKNDVEITNSSKAIFDHGFAVSLNFQIHLPIVGATASIYSKPSKECRMQQDKKVKNKKSSSESDSAYPKRPDSKLQAKPEYRKEKNEFDQEEKETEPQVPSFDASIADEIDVLGADPDIMIAYDTAVKEEKRKDKMEHPEDVIDAWKVLVKTTENNPFLKIAKDRLRIWISYQRFIKEKEEKHQKDRENIEKMLPLDASVT